MNNIDKLNVALGLIKQAGTPFGLLKTFLGKAKPLFHGVNPANQRGLITNPKALSAYEASAKNLINNTEGYGLARRPLAKLVSTPVFNNDKAFLNFEDALKNTGYLTSAFPRGAAINIAPFKYKGPVREYASSSFSPNLNMGAGKNWSNISFAPNRPYWNYGNFGVMTTPNRISGGVPAAGKSLLLGSEVTAVPKIISKSSGIPYYLELPQASGKLYYKPSPDNADFARQLIKAHGRHNVIPLNSSNLRKIDNITKEAPVYDYNPEIGNLSRKELDDRFPDYDSHYNNVKSWFSDMQRKHE